MAGKRQPVELVIAKGKKHLTAEETDARLDAEIKVKAPVQVRTPTWLPRELSKGFLLLARQLVEAGIFTRLDVDTLGRYVLAQQQYLSATNMAQKALVAQDVDGAKDWSAIQERYFKQCRSCAGDLGLTISARCRLVLPEGTGRGEEPDEDDEFSRRLKRRQAMDG
ncbi:MAG: phage terminase small subunit P27 family [Oscillospiraceae bacterium]